MNHLLIHHQTIMTLLCGGWTGGAKSQAFLHYVAESFIDDGVILYCREIQNQSLIVLCNYS